MGKNLRQQRRGRGTQRYRSPGHNYLGKVRYMPAGEGRIVDIIHAPGRHLPVAVVDFSGKHGLVIPHEGASTGQFIKTDSADPGNIVALRDVPEGSRIYNIELAPGDGGRLCRSSGAFATLLSREEKKCVILLPSKQKKTLPAACRATAGTAASSGRTEKPFRKAGNKHFAMKALGRLYPHVRGVAMNAVDHPFGGQTRPGKVKSTSRHAPPGKKVGNISPRRTGKTKR